MENHPSARGVALDEIARRHGFGSEAVDCMLDAVIAGHGRLAQFDHPEFGGAGQWMHGGMTMVSDMFHSALKARVQSLCDDLARLIASDTASRAGDRFADRDASIVGPNITRDRDRWWPAELGSAESAGAQNGVRYAYFAANRRLAIDIDGRVTIYDTLDHRIRAVAQQQHERGSVTFSSQHGTVNVGMLPVVSDARPDEPGSDVFAAIEKLAELRSRGVLSEAEFSAKKTELLRRV